jgi:hypothetical protein
LEYVHLPEGSDAHSGHGVKAHWDERTVRHAGRDVLYLLTDAVVDTVCCGDRVFHYATVLGYVKEWRMRTTDSGHAVSLIESVTEPAMQSEIEALLKQEDRGLQVTFRSDQL